MPHKRVPFWQAAGRDPLISIYPMGVDAQGAGP